MFYELQSSVQKILYAEQVSLEDLHVWKICSSERPEPQTPAPSIMSDETWSDHKWNPFYTTDFRDFGENLSHQAVRLQLL